MKKTLILLATLFILAACNSQDEPSFFQKSSWGHQHTSKFLYSFGALSDIHLNQSLDSGSYCKNDFIRAMIYLTTVKNTDFTCVCGDLTFYGWKGAKSMKADLSIYDSIKSMFRQPIYVCAGNHDCDSIGNNPVIDSIWKQYTGCPRNYVFEYKGDVFAFMSMDSYFMTKGYPAYRQSDLDWLTATLRKYKDKRVFLWTHLFMKDYTGDFMQIYMASQTFRGEQYEYLKNLLAEYPNVINFSGHSHYRWYLQNYDPIADIGKIGNGAIMMHLPSCAFPRDATYNGYADQIKSSTSANWTSIIRPDLSEIGYVDVYDDHIVIHGLELTGNPAEDFGNVGKDYTEVTGACFSINMAQ